MHWFMGSVLVLALGVMGCGEASGPGGTGGDGGSAGVGGGGSPALCVDNVCACTEAGIRAAIAEGGGPFTFDCDGPSTVRTKATIVIDNDVTLDGEGNLTVSAIATYRVFVVDADVTATLDGITVTGGHAVRSRGGGIRNFGALTLMRCTVSRNYADELRGCGEAYLPCGGGGIYNAGMLRIIDSTVSENGVNRGSGGGIYNDAFTGTNFPLETNLTIVNSTISGNIVDEGVGGGIYSVSQSPGALTLSSSTVANNAASNGGGAIWGAVYGGVYSVVVSKSIVDGDCGQNQDRPLDITSDGYNVESPGDTCGFDQPTDQVHVPRPWLSVLRDNGGPTKTHQLFVPSVAIDVIPEADCVDADGVPLTTDQRGEPRPGGTMCDVGAFEVQP
jgi:hypothetical protein